MRAIAQCVPWLGNELAGHDAALCGAVVHDDEFLRELLPAIPGKVPNHDALQKTTQPIHPTDG